MDPVNEQLMRLQQNPGNWGARIELAHLWKERGVEIDDRELLAGAIGAPHNRRDLQRLLDALDGPPRVPAWAPVLDEYLRWSPGCPLGHAALAHVAEESGRAEEALSLYETATHLDPSVSLPPLYCLREPEEKKPAAGDSTEEPPRKLLEDTRFVSLMVALGVHLFLIIFLSLWVIYAPPVGPPRIVAHAPTEETSITPTQRIRRTPTSALSKTDMQIDSAVALTEMAVSMQSPTPAESPSLLVGSDFSPSMSFGQDSGGSVSFFGSKSQTRKLVYVVDVSGSMQFQGEGGKTRIQLLREELKRSVSALPLSVRYQIILFSNKAWFAGDEPEVKGFMPTGADDPDNYSSRPLVRATQSQKRRTLADIDEITSGGGTNWRLPLKMAMKLEPDLIYFMTDGEIDTDSGEVPVIDDVVEYNRKRGNAKVNTICLMEIKAYEKLQDLANRTKGTVFLVQEDGTVLRGMQLDQLLREQK